MKVFFYAAMKKDLEFLEMRFSDGSAFAFPNQLRGIAQKMRYLLWVSTAGSIKKSRRAPIDADACAR